MENNNLSEEPTGPYNQPLDFQQVWQMFQETDRILTEKFQETDKQFKETDKRIRELDRLFTSQWVKLVESLIKGDLVKLLKGRGISVQRLLHGVEGNYEGQNYEYDLIAVNGNEIVIVEVKTTLRPDDVDHFHRKLWKAKTWMPEYQNKKIFGAVAYISLKGDSHRMAENLGFFVIRATGSSSSIINQEDFKPKAF